MAMRRRVHRCVAHTATAVAVVESHRGAGDEESGRPPCPFVETRAVLIEDLDGLAFELMKAGSD